MKIKIIGALLLAAALSASADILPIDKPTDRTKELEEEFGIQAIGQLKEGEVVYCVFRAKLTEASPVAFPIVVRADATDDQVKAALCAAINCAEFYEKFMARKKHK
jgi:hypothetical protein